MEATRAKCRRVFRPSRGVAPHASQAGNRKTLQLGVRLACVTAVERIRRVYDVAVRGEEFPSPTGVDGCSNTNVRGHGAFHARCGALVTGLLTYRSISKAGADAARTGGSSRAKCPMNRDCWGNASAVPT